jgi:aqualysin 1
VIYRDSTAWYDEHGHGTHVAGIIGARDNSAWTVGVAPGTRLFSVRVFDQNGSGSVTGILKGIDWIHRQRRMRPTTPMVVNMSLITGASLALDRAVKALIDSGITVVVAAGNSGTLASNFSPSRLPEAITVAASTTTGALASFSNYGSAVDVIAPGVNILSSKWQGGVIRKSGTSMATPHVTGAVALYLSHAGNGTKTPAQVTAAIMTSAQAWGISLPSGTPNRMLRVRPF